LTVHQEDRIAKRVLDRLKAMEKYPEEHLAPYKEFSIGGRTYYFSPGGLLFRRDPDRSRGEDSFCGLLSDRVWPYPTDDG
jgi:hypothetical protein